MSGGLSTSRRRKIFNITGGRCFYCGCYLDFNNFHADHFNAKSNGGKERKNLVPACIDCNLAKSNLSIEQFREKIQNSLYNTHRGRLIAKHYDIEPKKIAFFFEGKY